MCQTIVSWIINSVSLFWPLNTGSCRCYLQLIGGLLTEMPRARNLYTPFSWGFGRPLQSDLDLWPFERKIGTPRGYSNIQQKRSHRYGSLHRVTSLYAWRTDRRTGMTRNVAYIQKLDGPSHRRSHMHTGVSDQAMAKQLRPSHSKMRVHSTRFIARTARNDEIKTALDSRQCYLMSWRFGEWRFIGLEHLHSAGRTPVQQTYSSQWNR